MIKNFCSLCGKEIKQAVSSLHNKPRIEETRDSITGDEINIMMWIECKVNIGFICPTCKDMYVKKLLTCLATTVGEVDISPEGEVSVGLPEAAAGVV